MILSCHETFCLAYVSSELFMEENDALHIWWLFLDRIDSESLSARKNAERSKHLSMIEEKLDPLFPGYESYITQPIIKNRLRYFTVIVITVIGRYSEGPVFYPNPCH
jgi:hypothetical protein